MIQHSFPDDTIRIERSRVETLREFEILQCFNGRVAFVDKTQGREMIVLNNAPVLGLASDLCEALLELLSGTETFAFNDFYGEFGFEISRIDKLNVQVRECFHGVSFIVERAKLVQACDTWCEAVIREMVSIWPDLLKNAAFPSAVSGLGVERRVDL